VGHSDGFRVEVSRSPGSQVVARAVVALPRLAGGSV